MKKKQKIGGREETGSKNHRRRAGECFLSDSLLFNSKSGGRISVMDGDEECDRPRVFLLM